MNTIQIQQLAAAQLEKPPIDLRTHYGAEKMHRLVIDHYGGAYSRRELRSGT